MALALDEYRSETSLEYVPHMLVPAVEALRVHAIHLPHPPGQVRVGSFNKEVVVITHQAEGVKYPAIPIDRRAKYAQEDAAIGVVQKDVRLRITARGDVVNGTGVFEAQGPSHALEQRIRDAEDDREARVASMR